MKTLSLWIFGLLLMSPTVTNGLNHFPNNFVVAKRHDQVTLTCSPKAEGNVTWRYSNMLDASDVRQDGQNLTVVDADTPTLGEFSCWVGDEMLSSTYLLLEHDDEEETDSLIRCWAKSYDCNFSCTWTSEQYTAVRLGVGDDCSKGGKSCAWVNSSSKQLQDGGFQFNLSHSLSPYAEESTKFELTVEAITELSILRRTKRFYLRDIVQPDSPNIVKYQEVGDFLNVSIDPPSSWSTPSSFFVLEHQIEYQLKDNGETRDTVSDVVPKMINRLRVRSRDPVVGSSWSQWTSWKNVTQ